MVKQITIILVVAALTAITINAQKKEQLMKQYKFAMESQNYLEGFSKSIGENDFSYHSSLRIDVTESMLVRCTDGTMAIEWITNPVPKDHKKGGVWFTWLAALDLSGQHHKFDVYINDVKRFEFLSGNEQDRQFNNEDDGILKYTTIDFDQHRDGHGYMSLYTPEEWIKPGEPVKIKIQGEKAGSNTWIIIYKASDVLSYLRNIVKYETWLNVIMVYDGEDTKVNFTAPIIREGTSLKVNIGESKKTVELSSDEKNAVGQFVLENIDARKQSLLVEDNEARLIELEKLNEETKQQKLLSKSLLINEVKIESDETTIFCQRIYKPNTVDNLVQLSKSNLSSGKIYLMNSSHQDIAWMDSPEKCVIERDTMLLSPLYEKAINSDPSYRFDIEDALMLKEYIQRHPNKKEGIKKLLNEGKISCGSTYIQPYEEMYSGEALVRQFYFGTRWLKKEFDYDARVYWNVDVPGKLLQMPQIMKKAGTVFMVISRFEKGIYNWYSPDGSFVTTYSPGHYGNSYGALQKNVYDAGNYLAESSLYWEKYYTKNNTKNAIPLLSDWDMSPAKDYSDVINNWESINEIENGDGSKSQIQLPKFKIATAEEFLTQFTSSKPVIPSLHGERPAVWLYIHGPSHYEALKNSREADILLTMAEKFSTIDALTSNSFSNYPTDRLEKAWEAKIYPDHGWGGKEGEITDNLFLSKFVFAKNEALQLTENAANSIASKVDVESDNGLPLIVFNSLSWERTDPVEFKIQFDESGTKSIEVSDNNEQVIQSQLSEVNYYEDGSIKDAVVNFIGNEIPSVGYKTFYVKQKSSEDLSKKYKSEESKFYKIEFSNGGLKSIYDKELNKEILDVSKFKGGEVFTMKSEGHGAGEFADVQQPTMDGFDKTGNYETAWELIENGPVFSTFKMRQQIRNSVVEQKVILYKDIKRIDFKTDLLNWEGILYREYRLALPVNIKNGEVSYETAFGISTVGKDEIDGAAGERYTTDCKEIHPRGIENWISVNNDEFGVALSSCVAVADYIDPTDIHVDNTILQPILLASRRSCHGEGNEYLQTGDHYYSFSLTSYKTDDESRFKFGKQINEKPFVVVNPKQYSDSYLDEEMSFFSTGNDETIISAIKKGEDDNSTIIRFYDIGGKDSKIKLSSFKNIKKAYHTNIIEEGVQPLDIDGNEIPFNLGHQSIETFKLFLLP